MAEIEPTGPSTDATPDPTSAADLSPGVPGASAKAEHARRLAARERRTRAAHPRIGGLLLALKSEPQHERAWATGGLGEEQVAERLAKYCDGTPVRFLHDRRVPGRRANIDHLAIAPSGVYVIDAKRYTGKVDVEVTGGLLRPRVETLRVGGRDRTKLAGGLEGQVDVVRMALGERAEATPVHGALCFVDSQMPLARKLRVREIAVSTPRRLSRRLKSGGPLTEADIEALYVALVTALPSAA